MIGEAGVGEGMRVMAAVGFIRWALGVADDDDDDCIVISCTSGKSEGAGSLFPNAQKIIV